MIGSIFGDIVGSVYEFANTKNKDFELLPVGADYTDDSILSIATAHWLLDGGDVASYYLRYGTEYPYPMGGYGGSFKCWLVQSSKSGKIQPPYGSCGNGSAMRVSPVGWAFDNLDDTLRVAAESARCTHDHPEGIKGAQATAQAIFMARHGASPVEIAAAITEHYGYDLSLTVDEIRPRYSWDGLDDGTAGNGATCQGSVPQAIVCALQATDYEDAVRNAVSIGGDSDTIACITGGIAEALFGLSDDFRTVALQRLPDGLRTVVERFVQRYC